MADRLTIGEAAEALGVSVKTLRRWSDEGRIAAERTAGGHRRFAIAEVQRILARGRTRPHGHRLSPPPRPLPLLAGLLASDGVQLMRRVERELYVRGPRGWFASALGRRETGRWLLAIGDAARLGDYRAAHRASAELARRMRVAGVSMLECDSVFELLGASLATELAGHSAAESAGTRQLMGYLRQAVLHEFERSTSETAAAAPGNAAAAGLARGTFERIELARALATIDTLPDIERVSLFTNEGEGLELQLAGEMPSDGGAGAVPERIVVGDGPLGGAALAERPRVLLSSSRGLAGRRGGTLLAAPLRSEQRLVGLLCLEIRASRPVAGRDIALLAAFADEIALAATAAPGAATRPLDEAIARFRSAWASAPS